MAPGVLEVQDSSVYVPENCKVVILHKRHTTIALPKDLTVGWRCTVVAHSSDFVCDFVPNDEDDHINGIRMDENVTMRAHHVDRPIDIVYVVKNFIVSAPLALNYV